MTGYVPKAGDKVRIVRRSDNFGNSYYTWKDEKQKMLERGGEYVINRIESGLAIIDNFVFPFDSLEDASLPPAPPKPWQRDGDMLRFAEQSFGYTLTDIFNFKTGEREHIVESLQNKTLSAAPPQPFCDVPDDLMQTAIAKYKEEGGEYDGRHLGPRTVLKDTDFKMNKRVP